MTLDDGTRSPAARDRGYAETTPVAALQAVGGDELAGPKRRLIGCGVMAGLGPEVITEGWGAETGWRSSAR